MSVHAQRTTATFSHPNVDCSCIQLMPTLVQDDPLDSGKGGRADVHWQCGGQTVSTGHTAGHPQGCWKRQEGVGPQAHLRPSPAAILRTACSSCATSRKMRSSSLAHQRLIL